MGRKPLAPEIKKQSGAYKKDPQRENKHAPSALYGMPSKPEQVAADEEASKKWDHIVGMLDRMNVLAETDSDLLARYCTTWSQWCRVHAELMVVGHVIYGEKGQSRSPQSTSFVALNGELHRMSSELGLSPSSRGKLIANPDVKENDPFAEWLKKRGAN